MNDQTSIKQKGFGLIGWLMVLAIVVAGGYWVWKEKVVRRHPSCGTGYVIVDCGNKKYSCVLEEKVKVIDCQTVARTSEEKETWERKIGLNRK